MPKPALPFSEDQLTAEFAEQYKNTIRYIPQFGKWYNWNGSHWELDTKNRAGWRCLEFLRMKANEIARSISRSKTEKITKLHNRKPTEQEREEIAEEMASVHRSMLSARRFKNIMSMAVYNKSFTLDVSHWDADPWLLNTPSGTVELRTGKVRNHNPLDYITKKTDCAVSFDAPEQWLKFLHRIMEGDTERINYVQKLFGYSLAGLTKENRMWFFHGTGANGKSVMLNALYKIFGNYARWTPSSTFMRTFTSQHPTDLAGLYGTRLVMCGEVGKNSKWDEERIKSITGGDPITARFMRQDFFDYTPQFTVVLAGNHKPDLEHVDEAVARRFNLLPFDVTIPEYERDKELGEKLQQEYPQILGWLIQGCLAWQTEGLKAPKIVREATDSYFTRSDYILAWLNECCELRSDLFTSSADLFKSYDEWMRDNGEPGMSQRKFALELEDRGRALKINKMKTKKARGFGGIGLLALDE